MKEEQRNKIYKVLDYLWIILAIFIFITTIKYLNDGTLEAKVASFGIWAPIILVLFKAATLVFVPLGGAPIYIISGAIYGTLKGFGLSIAGDILGTVICFWISRKYGTRAVKFFAGMGNFEKIRKALSLLNNTRSFIKARVALMSIPELLAYAAGLSQISFWKFFALHMPFYIPIDFVLVFLGDQIAEFTTRYVILTSFITIGVASFGIWLLAKDYRKLEGM